MARHITAKKQLTRDRALAMIDERIRIHKELMTNASYVGHSEDYHKHCLTELEQFRGDVAWACEVGVFPPSK